MAGPTDVYFFTDALGYGGAEKSLTNLLAGLDRNRWQPTLVYHESEAIAPLTAAARELQVDLQAVPRMPEGPAGAGRALSFARALRRRRPAIFHAQLTWPRSCKFGLAAAVLAGVQAVVATEHSFVDSAMTRSTYLQMRALGAGVSRYVAVSHHVKRCLVQAFGRPKEKIVVIPNGVDASSYEAAVDLDLRSRLSDGEQRRVVLALSRLDPRKGLLGLLDAAARLPDVHLVIAGDGPQREELTTLAARLGITDRVDLLGHRDDVPRLLACCDVFVQPSLNEAFGLGALEAMCAGRPVVATDVGGTRELVHPGETGVLVPPGDSAALATAIRNLLDDPTKAAALGEAGRRTAAFYSSQRMAGAVMDLYEELLTSERRNVWSQ